MILVSECLLPRAVEHADSNKDFLFFKIQHKKLGNAVQFKFVGQKMFETNQLTEFKLSSDLSSLKEASQTITRPRNCFIIMRTILHNVIIQCLERCDISSLKHVSAITSQLWGKNDGIFQLYFELLSQFEEHWHLNIYPEYRYHKVNKISRQLENKLVYQNMLNRMRYFTASSLLSELEDIVTLPAASAADTAVDATAAADAATAAERFCSTYTYSSFSSSQIGVNHQQHYHHNHNRQMKESPITAGNFRPQNLAYLQESESFETLQNKRCKTNFSSSSKNNRNNKCTVLKQEELCDRIKFAFPKKDGRSSVSFKKTRIACVTKGNGVLKKDLSALETAITLSCAVPASSASPSSFPIQPDRLLEHYVMNPNHITDLNTGDANNFRPSCSSIAYNSKRNRLDTKTDTCYLKKYCKARSQEHLTVEDLFLQKASVITLSSEKT